MATVFIRHGVTDYTTWRTFYDADLPRRKAAGLKEIGVYRDANDENMLLVVFEVDNPQVIQELLQSEDLAKALKEAGVKTKPAVWVGNPLD